MQADDSVKQYDRELTALQTIGRKLIGPFDMASLQETIVDAVVDTVPMAEAASLWLLDETQNAMVARSWAGYDDHVLANLSVPLNTSLIGLVSRKGEPQIIEDTAHEPAFEPLGRAVLDTVRSVLGVPLIVEGRVIGELFADNFSHSQAFTEHDALLLTLLANHATIGLQTKKLQTANQHLDAFSSTVAHSLKSPVITMLGFSGLLQKEYASLSEEELHHRLEFIVQAGRKMEAIINQLLLLATVRKKEISHEPIAMASIIKAALHRLKPLIETSHATIVMPEAWPGAWGHAPWVEEVWVNYISNALKYGGRPPRIILGADVQPEGMVRYWIQDNGPGLTRKEQAQLFTPFIRLGSARSEGDGLGLSIARWIMEKLGGKVGVTSKGIPGQGCVFSFTLPAGDLRLPPGTEAH